MAEILSKEEMAEFELKCEGRTTLSGNVKPAEIAGYSEDEDASE